MKTDRRGFFRLSLRLAGGALAARGWRSAAAASEIAPLDIHRATRNTRSGAIGEALRSLREPGPPLKPYPGAERLALPRGPDEPMSLRDALGAAHAVEGFAGTPLALPALARLLRLANGVTGRLSFDGGIPLRAAPSAGALYAGELYVVAQRVEGLPPGVYYYAVHDHALVRLREAALAESVTEALEESSLVDGAAAFVLLTNVFERYMQRYRNRGWRYALIDTGHIGENLRLAAAAARLRSASPRRFRDEALDELLGVDGSAEAVCALHALGAPGEAPPAAGARRALVERQRALPDPPESPGPAILRAHRATALVPAPAPPAAPRAPRGAPPTRPAAQARPLGPHAAPGLSLDAAIRQRRSALRFEPEPPIALAELAFVAEQAAGRRGPDESGEVDLLFSARRVRGIEPGLYRLEPGGRAAIPLVAGDLGDAVASACLGQEKARRAAVAFLMVADLARAGAEGGRRYRDLLIDAGAMGQRIYLAAEAVGLAARNLAAYLDDELDRVLGLDPERERVIHLTLLGREG